MKKVIVIVAGLFFVSFQSCKDKCNNLREVEEVVTQMEATPIGDPAAVCADGGPFAMKGLPYAYEALLPYIDVRTVEIHYSKHHLGYVNNLNKAIKGTPLEKQTLEQILTTLDLDNKVVRDNAGGYYNHNLYWEVMAPKAGGEPTEILAEAIRKEFGSFETFKKQFSDAGAKQFGSGWAWLVVDKMGKLVVGSTPNQDNPLMPHMGISGIPILGMDVWEHAYYLKYQNKRADYIEAFFNLINWEVVMHKYEEALTKK